MNICAKCGLPDDLCVCESIAKESQKITVTIEKKKFGKKYTVIKGINQKEIDVEQLCKELKSKFACGGTYKENQIELQGNHKNQIKKILVEKGFAPETILVK